MSYGHISSHSCGMHITERKHAFCCVSRPHSDTMSHDYHSLIYWTWNWNRKKCWKSDYKWSNLAVKKSLLNSLKISFAKKRQKEEENSP